MPAHDWTRLGDGPFHSVHSLWIGELCKRLNAGLLSDDYEATSERVFRKRGPDLRIESEPEPAPGGGIVLAKEPQTETAVRLSATPVAAYVRKQRQLIVRRAGGGELVAVVEFVSRGNKSSRKRLGDFLGKIVGLAADGCHLGIIDLHPCGRLDAGGIVAAAWEECLGSPPPGDVPDESWPGGGRSVASWKAAAMHELFADPVRVGQRIPDLPLFLSESAYVPLPLEETYMEAILVLPRSERRELGAE